MKTAYKAVSRETIQGGIVKGYLWITDGHHQRIKLTFTQNESMDISIEFDDTVQSYDGDYHAMFHWESTNWGDTTNIANTDSMVHVSYCDPDFAPSHSGAVEFEALLIRLPTSVECSPGLNHRVMQVPLIDLLPAIAENLCTYHPDMEATYELDVPVHDAVLYGDPPKNRSYWR